MGYANTFLAVTNAIWKHLTGSPGKTLYVSSTAGGRSLTGPGTDPLRPFSTLKAAVDTLVSGDANTGVRIFILPGHTESISSAALIAMDIAGVRVIGQGQGRSRPIFTWTATASTWTITAANSLIENCVFDFTGIDAVVAGFVVDAADTGFSGCEFITNSATAGVVSGITVGGTTTSPRFSITNSRFIGPATNSGTTTTAQVTITDAPDFVFQNNYCTGKMTQSITNGATNLRGLIDNNRFVVATGTKAINMAAASTPFITNNRINVPSGTAPIVAAAGFVAGNVYSAAAGVTAGTASTI